jgi:hypothetical protein
MHARIANLQAESKDSLRFILVASGESYEPDGLQGRGTCGLDR